MYGHKKKKRQTLNKNTEAFTKIKTKTENLKIKSKTETQKVRQKFNYSSY